VTIESSIPWMTIVVRLRLLRLDIAAKSIDEGWLKAQELACYCSMVGLVKSSKIESVLSFNS
jgi:hypothetical protein